MKLYIFVKFSLVLAFCFSYFLLDANSNVHLSSEISQASKWLNPKMHNSKYGVVEKVYKAMSALSDKLDSRHLVKEGMNEELKDLNDILAYIHSNLVLLSTKDDEQQDRFNFEYASPAICHIMQAVPHLYVIGYSKRVPGCESELAELEELLYKLYSVGQEINPNIDAELCDEETFIAGIHNGKKFCGCPEPFGWADMFSFAKDYPGTTIFLGSLGLWRLGFLNRFLPARFNRRMPRIAAAANRQNGQAPAGLGGGSALGVIGDGAKGGLSGAGNRPQAPQLKSPVLVGATPKVKNPDIVKLSLSLKIPERNSPQTKKSPRFKLTLKKVEENEQGPIPKLILKSPSTNKKQNEKLINQMPERGKADDWTFKVPALPAQEQE